jgi:hypothetical protein
MSMPDMKWCSVDGFDLPPPPAKDGPEPPKVYVKWEGLKQAERDLLMKFVETDGQIDGGNLAKNYGLEEWPKAETALRAYYKELLRRYEGPIGKAIEARTVRTILDKLATVLDMGTAERRSRRDAADPRLPDPAPARPFAAFEAVLRRPSGAAAALASAVERASSSARKPPPETWETMPYRLRHVIVETARAQVLEGQPALMGLIDRTVGVNAHGAAAPLAMRDFMLGLTTEMMFGRDGKSGIVNQFSTVELRLFQETHAACCIEQARALLTSDLKDQVRAKDSSDGKIEDPSPSLGMTPLRVSASMGVVGVENQFTLHGVPRGSVGSIHRVDRGHYRLTLPRPVDMARLVTRAVVLGEASSHCGIVTVGNGWVDVKIHRQPDGALVDHAFSIVVEEMA